MGFIGSLASNVRTVVGGEVKQFTNMISEGRRLALDRLNQEVIDVGGQGATGVSSELIFHPGNIEFLSLGSIVHEGEKSTERLKFSTCADGQELYAQLDANLEHLQKRDRWGLNQNRLQTTK